MPVSRHWTTADVRELTQEDRPWPRYELIDGELLVTPAPRGPHQCAVGELFALLHGYLEHEPVGVVFVSPADLELRPGTIAQPDVFVVPAGSSRATGEPQWSEISALMLAVEILSASSVQIDRIIKRDFYLANHVEEYWIVDLDARVIERWRPAQETPELRRDTLIWTPRSGEPLIVDVDALFSRIDAKWQLLRGWQQI